MNEINPTSARKVPNIINVDWLEIMVTSDLVDDNAPLESYKLRFDFELQKMGYGSKIFKNGYEVRYRGLPFGTYHVNPRENMLKDKRMGKLKINNIEFYKAGWFERVKDLLIAMGAKYRNTTRLDIAADGFGFLNLAAQCGPGGSLKKRGRADFRPVYVGGEDLQTAYFGSRKSGKQVTVYNKSKEIKKSGKLYIYEWWKRSGLVGDHIKEDVHRCEVSLKHEEIKRIADYDFDHLWNFEYLACILRTSLNKFVDFYDRVEYNAMMQKKKSERNVSRLKVIDLLDFDFMGGELLPKDYSITTSKVYSTKVASKKNYQLFLHSEARGRKMPELFEIAHKLAASINCVEWFMEKLPDWQKEYERDKKYGRDKTLDIFLAQIERVRHGKQFGLVVTDNRGFRI